jgi:hypothetical protein
MGQGNLQGLGYWTRPFALTTTVQEDWSATCAPRWRRLNTFQPRFICREISLAGLEELLPSLFVSTGC